MGDPRILKSTKLKETKVVDLQNTAGVAEMKIEERHDGHFIQFESEGRSSQTRG